MERCSNLRYFLAFVGDTSSSPFSKYKDRDFGIRNYNCPAPVPPHVLMTFRGFPPGCGDSVADF